MEKVETQIRAERVNMEEEEVLRSSLIKRKAEIDQELSIDMDKAQGRLRTEHTAQERRLRELSAQEEAEAA